MSTSTLRTGIVASRPAPRRAALRVHATAARDTSGIHDPIGWGQRAKSVKPHEAGLAAQRELQAEELRRMEQRSGSRVHPAPTTSASARLAAQAELLDIERDRRADEEYNHLSKAQRTVLRVKEWFFEWLKTGVEPL